jgi:hypothetical protein
MDTYHTLYVLLTANLAAASVTVAFVAIPFFGENLPSAFRIARISITFGHIIIDKKTTSVFIRACGKEIVEQVREESSIRWNDGDRDEEKNPGNCEGVKKQAR